VSQVKEVLAYAKNDLGLSDTYNSDRGFVNSKMTPVAKNLSFGENSSPMGLFKRDDRDICKAIRLEGEGEFRGTVAATPQKFNNGAIIVQQGNDIKLIQPEIFDETYRLAVPTVVSSTPLSQSVPPGLVDAKTVAIAKGKALPAESSSAAEEPVVVEEEIPSKSASLKLKAGLGGAVAGGVLGAVTAIPTAIEVAKDVHNGAYVQAGKKAAEFADVSITGAACAAPAAVAALPMLGVPVLGEVAYGATVLAAGYACAKTTETALQVGEVATGQWVTPTQGPANAAGAQNTRGAGGKL